MTPQRMKLSSMLVIAGTIVLAIAPVQAHAVTLVSGTQSGTWTLAGSPYIVTGSVTVSSSLTIETGVWVRVRPGLNIAVFGTLATQGTVAQRVVITCDADTVGGSPTPGGWTGLLAENGSTLLIEETEIRYGGGGGWANLATSFGTASSVTWNGGGAFFSSNDGVRLNATNVSLLGMGAFSNAVDGIEMNTAYPPALASLTSIGNGGYAYRVNASPGSFPSTLLASTNGKNGIYVTGSLGGSAAEQKWTWGANTTCPYIVGNLTVAGPDSLEIAAGAVVKFDAAGS